MARRKSKQTDAAGGALYFILIVMIPVILFLVKIFLFSIFILYVPVALGIWIATFRVKILPPEILISELYDDAAKTRIILDLISQRNDWQKFIEQQYASGKSSGKFLTKQSGETRFDTRSNLGKQLNEKLDKADAAIDQIMQNTIPEIRDEVSSSLPNWRADFDKWVQLRSLKLSLYCALYFLGGSSGIFYLWFVAHPSILSDLGQFLTSNPNLSLPTGSILMATLVSCTTFGVALSIYHTSLPKLIEGSRAAGWRNLQAKWSNNKPVDDFFVIQHSNFQSYSNYQNHSSFQDYYSSLGAQSYSIQNQNREPTWFEVLGVSADAQPKDIKLAYYEKMKGYHSDKVASLGQELRDLADVKSKQINLAYDEARKRRNF